MKNIHVLPTDKPSRLFDFMTALVLIDKISPNDSGTNQHIYITNNEEIKDGDWNIKLKINRISKSDFSEDILKTYIAKHYKKIILTTDQELIKDGVQSVDDTFLDWFVMNQSCEEVEIQKILLGKVEGTTMWVSKYKIIIPKEEPKQETTLEEVAQWVVNNRYAKSEFDKISDSEMYHTIIDKFNKIQQERSYSEEEVINMLIDISNYVNTKELRDNADSNFNEWVRKKDWFIGYLFEQFKKK